MRDTLKETQYINAVLLLLLAFLPNYTGTLIGCKLGRLISSSNVVLKFGYVLLLVFSCFTVVDEENTHPLALLRQSLGVVFLFNLFNRQKYHTLVASLILLICVIFTNKLVRYYKTSDNEKHKKWLDWLNIYADRLSIYY